MRLAIPAIFLLAAVATAPACTVGPKSSDGTGPGSTSGATGTSEATDTSGTPPTTDSSPTTTATTGSPSTTGVTPPATTTSAGTSGISSDGDSSDFIVRTDVGGSPETCDLAKQDCPEGQKCNPADIGGQFVYAGAPVCVPVVPDAKPPQAPCTNFENWVDGTDDCELGAFCDDVYDVPGNSTCRTICNVEYTEFPACPPGLECFNYGCQECFFGYCDVPCDPRDLDACPAQKICSPFYPMWACVRDDSRDEGQAGDPCEYLTACDPGLTCINADQVPGCSLDAIGCCSPVCSTDAPNTCPNAAQGEECVPWFFDGEPPPQYATLGVCALPL